MKSKSLGCIVAMTLFAALTISVRSSAQEQKDDHGNRHPATFKEFEAPGAGTGAYQGTAANDINPAGAITGLYFDTSDVGRGFLRNPDGTFKTFAAPGAGTTAGLGTNPQSINSEGRITGFDVDAKLVHHGFLRNPGGKITTFNVKGAGTGKYQGTFAYCINAAGEIAGDYLDASSVYHGFVIDSHGKLTTFNAKGAGTGAYQGTITASEDCLSPSGAIAGGYIDGSNVYHGLVRAPDGTITTFNVKGAGTASGQGTFPGGIDPAGAIAGYYLDGSNVYHGFTRAADGTITTFNVKGGAQRPARAPSERTSMCRE